MIETIGLWLGVALTLFILSYLIGDNPFYRIAVNLFVGASAGLVIVTIIFNVLIPIASNFSVGNLIGLFLALLLAIKMVSPNFGPGRLSLAVLVGIGVAVSVAGALTGTLLPQADLTAFQLDLVGGATSFEQLLTDVIVFGGVVCVLIAFHYGARYLPDGKTERPAIFRAVTYVGQVFMGVALGLMYGGALVASVGYLADRLIYLWDFISRLTN